MTQAEILVRAIRASRGKGLTYGELNDIHASSCGWKRLAESGHRYLKAGEQLIRRVGQDGLKRFVIARG